MKGFQHINRGIGSLFFADSWLDEEDPVKPSQIVVMYGANDLVKHNTAGQVVYQDDKAVFCTEADIPELMQNAERFLKKPQKIYPEAKLHVLTRVYSAVEMARSRAETQVAYNRALTALCEQLGLHCIDGDRLIPHIPDCRVEDREHFNELGNALLALALAKQIHEKR